MDDTQRKRNEYKKAWALKNIEKRRESRRQYARNNKDKVANNYQQNKEKYKKRSSERYYAKKEEISEQAKKYRAKNKLRKRQYDREFRRNCPARQHLYKHNKRAKKLGLLHPDRNTKILFHLFDMRERLTKCLGILFSIDHIVPYSKGGWHHEDNIQVIPGKLNNRKSAKLEYIHPFVRDASTVSLTSSKKD